jgi:(R,R)-butanediol dehydrogenase/meso-butanediol dehydrogenase/diacetyl reductase
MHAIRLSNFRVGDTAVVLGAGPIGLLVQQILKAAGAGEIYVSEPAPARAEAAAKLGATRVFDPRSEDVVAEVVAATDGLGAPVVFDCAAAKPTLQQGLEMARRGGQVVVVSLAWVEIPLLTVEWVGREVEMKAAYGSTPDDWKAVLRLMERGQIDHAPMVTPESFIGFDEMQSSLTRLMSPDEHIQLVLAP